MRNMDAKKKILIVDDDAYLLNAYAAKFKEEGFDVTTATDGQAAWDLIQKGYAPDVMFTGILMPRMSGFDLVQKMQADPKLAAIPVAISSHRGRQEDRVTAKKLGVDDFLAQGLVPLNEVVRRIRLLLGDRRSYFIELERHKYDVEALVSLLDKQRLSFFGSEINKRLFLELEADQEKGVFKVQLIEEEPK